MVNIFYVAVLFLIGVAMGSAANALIDRLPRNESWFKGRSKCDKCRHALNGKDLIPIFSYISLKGRCRYCRSPIPYRNLILEIILGLSFIVINGHSLSFNSLLLSFIAVISVIIAVMDWETMMVSEALIVVWGGLVILANWANAANWANWGGVLVGVGLIGGLWVVSRGRAMGFGDVEIAAVVGWWLGWPKVLIGLWAAFVSGAVVALCFVWQ
jgi:leader peptidase (prepilin peptidase)/N-methyltransferase